MRPSKLVPILLWLAYPAIIFFGIQYFQPRYVAMLLTLLLILRWKNEAGKILSTTSWVNPAVFSVLLLVVMITAITNNEMLLRLYPVFVSLGMLFIFSLSLKYPPSIVERFARLHAPELPAAGILYTRQVTQVWCGFFVLNGSIAAFTAIYTSREIWSLYNGFIAYLLMGGLFAGEWLLRRHIVIDKNN